MMSKPRIIFFSLSSYELFFPRQNVTHGGAELQIYYLAKELAETKEFDVSIIVGDYGQSKIKNYKDISLIKSFNLPSSESLFLKLFKAFKLIYILLKLRPDVIFTTSANSIVGVISFYKTIFKKKHIHRTASLVDVNNLWISQNGILGKIYKYGLKNANYILTQSNEHKILLKHTHNIDAIILRNAFPFKQTKISNKNLILWVGRYDKIKRPEVFLKIAKKIRNYKFVMICPPSKKDFKDWQKLKQEARLLKNMNFIEEIPYNEIQPYFNRAKIFVNTSLAEGFPNTFLQAAIGQTPIASLNVNPDNYLIENNCGLISDDDLGKFITQINGLLKNDRKLKEMGYNNLNYLIKNHELSIITQQFTNIIKTSLEISTISKL